jgi:RNA polymerase sigma factor (sigma-70 family)
MSTGIASGGPATPPVAASAAASPALDPRDLPVGEAGAGELLRRAAEGSAPAWDELVRRYERLVWSVARTYRLSGTDAADAVQTTWLRLVEHLGSITDPERLGSWLATTTRRESLRLARRAARERHDLGDDALDVLADHGAGVDQALLADEQQGVLLRGLRALDERCQSLLRVLSASPPPRYDAVAEAFGMPIGSIGPTRGRCLDRLRTELVALGWTSSDGLAGEAR